MKITKPGNGNARRLLSCPDLLGRFPMHDKAVRPFDPSDDGVRIAGFSFPKLHKLGVREVRNQNGEICILETLCDSAGQCYSNLGRWVKLRLLELRMRLLEVRMTLIQGSIRCFECGYLAPDKANLTSYGRYIRAAIYHPVEIVNVLFESWHKVQNDVWPRPNARGQAQPPGTAADDRKSA